MPRCDLCSVDVPEGNEALEAHRTGKRHLRAELQLEQYKERVARSVFVKWSNPAVSWAVLEPTIQRFGKIDQVLNRSQNSQSVIIEFAETESALAALTAGQVQVEGVTAVIVARELRLATSPYSHSARHIDVDAICTRVVRLDGFDAQLNAVIEKIALTPEQITHRTSLTAQLAEALADYCVEPRADAFGSSITSIGTLDSDLDVTVSIGDDYAPIEPRDKQTLLTCEPTLFEARKLRARELRRVFPSEAVRVLCRVFNSIRRFRPSATIHSVCVVPEARCPLVRLLVEGGLAIDVSYDNQLGRSKTLYLKTLLDTDESGNLRRFLLAFRFWADANSLTSSQIYQGAFNAYQLNLLFISYLQQRGNIPYLEYAKGGPVVDREWRIDFFVPSFNLAQLDLSCTFRDFFVTMVESGSEDKDLVYTLRRGRISKAQLMSEFDEEQKKSLHFTHLNIQDPLEHTHMVTGQLSAEAISMMRRAMMFGLSKLKKRKDFLGLLNRDFENESPSEQQTVRSRENTVTVAWPTGLSEATVAEVMETLLEGVLFLKKIENFEPKAKRAKADMGAEDREYKVLASVWSGRRVVRRRLQTDHKGVDLEKAISKTLASDPANAIDTMPKIAVHSQIEDGKLMLSFVPMSSISSEMLNAMLTLTRSSVEKVIEEASGDSMET